MGERLVVGEVGIGEGAADLAEDVGRAERVCPGIGVLQQRWQGLTGVGMRHRVAERAPEPLDPATRPGACDRTAELGAEGAARRPGARCQSNHPSGQSTRPEAVLLGIVAGRLDQPLAGPAAKVLLAVGLTGAGLLACRSRPAPRRTL
jgi:hypothetical protein